MKTVLRAALIAAVTALCIDAHAATGRHCVTMLEAQPAKPTTSTTKPCPVAVAWTRRSARAADTAPSVGVRA